MQHMILNWILSEERTLLGQQKALEDEVVVMQQDKGLIHAGVCTMVRQENC